MDNSDFVGVDEARNFTSEIPDKIERDFVEWAINRALLQPIVNGYFPSNKFDILFYAKIILEISRDGRAIKKILSGQKSDLW